MTYHYTSERITRQHVIQTYIGEGEEICAVYIDKHHKDGPEWHVLTTTGVINIYNAWSKILVTQLIARPGQLKRFECETFKVPEKIRRRAYINTVINHFNEL